MKLNLILILLVSLIVSCSKKLGPEESLREFVRLSINGKMDKATLLDSTTGNLKSELDALDEDQMSKYLKVEGASRDSFRVNLNNCQPTICFLTYTLKYEQSSNGTKSFDVELKKMAELRFVEEKWLLADITDIKTYYQAEQPIEP